MSDKKPCTSCMGAHSGDVVGHHPASCEWDPSIGEAAWCRSPYHADAVLSVGQKDNLHLCATCADLPVFARRTHRRSLRVLGSADASTE